MLEYLPDLFRTEVLARLGPTDLASLAGAGRAFAAAVAGTALMVWAEAEKRVPPRRSIILCPAPRLCLRGVCSLAARGGHLEVLKLLHNTGCSLGWSTSCSAAEGGHLAILKWLHSIGCPLAESTCAAARAGYLEVLKWLHNNGCPWDEDTCSWAAEGGHLAMLQWARERHCPWSKVDVRSYAADGRHREVVRWMNEHGGHVEGDE